MEIQGKFIVVKVTANGGSQTEAFSEHYARQHFIQWRDDLKKSNIEGFVKIFDITGREYVLEINNAIVPGY